jgi:hypothetical protein
MRTSSYREQRLVHPLPNYEIRKNNHKTRPAIQRRNLDSSAIPERVLCRNQPRVLLALIVEPGRIVGVSPELLEMNVQEHPIEKAKIRYRYTNKLDNVASHALFGRESRAFAAFALCMMASPPP